MVHILVVWVIYSRAILEFLVRWFEREWPHRRLCTIVLLKEHSNKMTPNDLCYIHWSVPCSAITSKTFLWLMGTNTETGNWTMCREWEILEHSFLNGISSSNFFNQSSGDTCRRRGRNMRRFPEDGWLKGSSVFQTWGLIHLWLMEMKAGLAGPV